MSAATRRVHYVARCVVTEDCARRLFSPGDNLETVLRVRKALMDVETYTQLGFAKFATPS